jgi:predicted MFS family arabinose efflux permease
MLGLMLGGWINDHASWRVALIGAGLSGIVLAVLLFLLVPDSRRPPEEATVPLRVAIKGLFAEPAFRALFLAISLVGASVYATLSFSAPFLIRTHGITTAQAGLWLGLMQGLAGVVGSLWGGRIFDRSAAAGGRHALRAPALSFLIAGPTAAAAWFVPHPGLAVVLLFPLALAVIFYIPASFGIAHRIAGPGQQGMASSILMIGVSLVGASAGPLVVGMISDALNPSLGIDALRWALLLVSVTNILAGLAFLAADSRFGASMSGERR